jgi:hypothetical protein
MFTPIRPSSAPRNSGKVSKSHRTPASAFGDMPSTRANICVMKSRSMALVGAIEKPQLPATTVVTPWKHDDVA